MAASKVMMSSSTSRNSDHNNNKLGAPLSAGGMYAYPETHSTQITLLDKNSNSLSQQQPGRKTVDDVWRDIVAGRRGGGHTSKKKGKKMKIEVPEEMMTLEDFLVRAGAVEEEEVEEEEEEVEEVKMPIPLTGYSFDSISLNPFHSGEGSSSLGFGNEGMSKRRASSLVVGLGLGLEPLDKAAEQRQRRMIKNRESAARSRERKQAYQIELESLAVKLEEENEQLLKEKAERNKERLLWLKKNIIPVVEKRRPPKALRRVHSFQW